MNVASSRLGLTIGVITHDRSTLFCDLLQHLKVSVEYAHNAQLDFGKCSLLVVNNSGVEARAQVQQLISSSNIDSVCPVDIIDSPENNIAVGRNLILENAQSDYLIFVDDDEYPVPEWIEALYLQMHKYNSAIVAGPIEPVYPTGTPGWVAAVDLHNKANLKTGDTVRRVATGNCLLDLRKVGSHRFDQAFGLSGGSDALFFDQLADNGQTIIWSETAIVYETIPASRTSSKYMIFRCMTQGQNFKRVVLRDATMIQRISFMLKAFLISPVSIIVGAIALPFSSQTSASWLKRGFTNLGKIIRPAKRLYG